MFFNALRAKPSPPVARPLEEQEERESQKLWAKVAQAVKDRNHELATDEKTKIEEVQREEAAARANDGVEWHPKLFRRVKGGPGAPEEGEEDLEWIINAHMLDEPNLAFKTHTMLTRVQRRDDTRKTGRTNHGHLSDSKRSKIRAEKRDTPENIYI